MTRKRLSKPWLTEQVLDLIKLKSTYFTILHNKVMSKSLNDSLKNRINSVVRKSKIIYYSQKFNAYKSNLNKTWDMIKHALSLTKNENSIKSILFNNVEVFANLFNNFFCNIPIELDNNIPTPSIDPLIFL